MLSDLLSRHIAGLGPYMPPATTEARGDTAGPTSDVELIAGFGGCAMRTEIPIPRSDAIAHRWPTGYAI